MVDSEGAWIPTQTEQGVVPLIPVNLPTSVRFQMGSSCDPNSSCLAWLPTDPNVGACDGITPTHVEAQIYEVAQGFALGHHSGSLTGIAFDDKDADGLRDEGEPGLAGLMVHILNDASECPGPFGITGSKHLWMKVRIS